MMPKVKAMKQVLSNYYINDSGWEVYAIMSGKIELLWFS